MGGQNDDLAPAACGVRRTLRLLALAALLLFGRGLAAATPDVPRLRAQFADAKQAADHIMLVDTSGSMRGYWATVVEAIADYTDALPDGDHVAIVCFDSEASNSRVLPRQLTERSRGELRAELLALPPPRGQRTDLGRGLAKLVDEIARPGANELQFLFLVSDFVHEPAEGSPFAGAAADQAWQDLSARTRLALAPRLVQAFALLLPLDGRVGRDLPHVRSVLGDVEGVPVVNQDTLREWFARRKAETVRAKLRALVRRDIQRGWDIELRAEGDRVVLAVVSRMERLPLVFTPTTIGIEGGLEVVGGAPRPTTLQPSQAVSIPLAIRRPAPAGWLERLLTPRRVRVERVKLHAEGTLRLEPADELGAALQVEPTRPIRTEATLDVAVVREGTSPFLQGILALALGLVAGGVWRVWLRPAPQVAAYLRSVSLHGRGHDTLDLPTGARSVTIGNEGQVDAASRLSEPRFAIRLLSRRPRFPMLRPRRGLYVERVSGDVYYEWEGIEVPVPDAGGRPLEAAAVRRLFVRSNPRPLEIDLET